MPKIAKTARPSVLFNPLAPSGHCKYCREIQPGPCQKPGCLLKEAKAAEDFADKTLATPAERFPARPGPDFVDVLSVLSMHTNNNLSKEAKAFNNELKLSRKEACWLSQFELKIHAHRSAGYGGVDLFARDVSIPSEVMFRGDSTVRMTLPMVKKLTDAGYQVGVWHDPDFCVATVDWNNDASVPRDDRTLHEPTGPLEPLDNEVLFEVEEAEEEEEPEEEGIPPLFGPHNRVQSSRSVYGFEACGEDTLRLIAAMEAYQPRGDVFQPTAREERMSAFVVRVIDNIAELSTTLDDIVQVVYDHTPVICWWSISYYFSSANRPYGDNPWWLFKDAHAPVYFVFTPVE